MVTKIDLIDRIQNKTAKVTIMGLGYVGLPLYRLCTNRGFDTWGVDSDSQKIQILNDNKSYIKHIDPESLNYTKDKCVHIEDHRFTESISDIFIICVPTPLKNGTDPDLSYVDNCIANLISPIYEKLDNGDSVLIILESTTYPGCTKYLYDYIKHELEENYLVSTDKLYMAFSPEREDPGNDKYGVFNIPKIVGGVNEESTNIAKLFYESICETVVPVSTSDTAEMTKLLENIYRCVNIALVNELKQLCGRMGIDIYEVINAASTKPFGYHPFYPGPGLGGHCIPIDPLYLSWKAKQFDFHTRFIELATQINTLMPYRVIDKIKWEMDKRGLVIKNSNIRLLGLAYKANVDDDRESPSYKIWEILQEHGANIFYYDPFIDHIHNDKLIGTRSEKIDDANYDVEIILSGHDLDYSHPLNTATLVVDTRNVIKTKHENLIKA